MLTPMRAILAFGFVAVLLAVPAVARADEAPPSITVMGTGTASGTPDVAEVSAGVVTQAPTAAQAMSQNSASMEQLLRAIRAQGVADRDVQTTNVSIVPVRAQSSASRPQPAAVTGYEVTNQARVKVRNLASLGRLLDTLVSQGANALGGIAFSIADPAPLLDQARTKAIADARQKAQVYAAAAGAKLGRVLAIRDTAAAGPPRPMAMRAMGTAPVPVAAGEQELEVSVSVTYALE